MTPEEKYQQRLDAIDVIWRAEIEAARKGLLDGMIKIGTETFEDMEKSDRERGAIMEIKDGFYEDN